MGRMGRVRFLWGASLVVEYWDWGSLLWVLMCWRRVEIEAGYRQQKRKS